MTTVLTDADVAYFHSEMRGCFDRDRKLVGNPTCDIGTFTYTGGNAVTGDQGTQTFTATYAGVECYAKAPTQRRIENSDGIIQPNDLEMSYYGIGILDANVYRIKHSGQYYTIIQQYVNPVSGRSNLIIRIMSGV